LDDEGWINDLAVFCGSTSLLE